LETWSGDAAAGFLQESKPRQLPQTAMMCVQWCHRLIVKRKILRPSSNCFGCMVVIRESKCLLEQCSDQSLPERMMAITHTRPTSPAMV